MSALHGPPSWRSARRRHLAGAIVGVLLVGVISVVRDDGSPARDDARPGSEDTAAAPGTGERPAPGAVRPGAPPTAAPEGEGIAPTSGTTQPGAVTSPAVEIQPTTPSAPSTQPSPSPAAPRPRPQPPPPGTPPAAPTTQPEPSSAPSEPTGPGSSPEPQTASVAVLVSQPGGRELVVPNGVYTGGQVSAPHDDWLVLRAESPGGVVVDLANTGLQLDDGTSKVVFVGFRFENGMVRLAGVSDVHFWYCDFTFPAAEWARQYKASGGRVPAGREARDEAIAKMANPFPTAVRMRQGMSDPSRDNQRVGFWGSDLHDLGDDGLFLARAAGLRAAGLRIWNVNEGRFDPGGSYGNERDWWHNDGIQTIGRLSDVAITDSWVGQKIQWGTESGDVRNATLRHLWLAGSSTFGQIAYLKTGRILANTEYDIRAFGNGRQNGPAYDRFRTDFVGDEQVAVWPEQYWRAGSFELAASGVTEGAPAGIEMRDGRIVDLAQVRNHLDNPANRWRAAVPYRSWRATLGI